MDQPSGIRNRRELYDLFDLYAAQKKEEISRHSLKAGSGLLKTYLLETSANNERDIVQLFRKVQWRLHPIDDELYEVPNLPRDVTAYVDMLSPRYIALYTTSPSTEADDIVRRAIRDSVDLDRVWFASPILNSIWQELPDARDSRHALLRFETEPLFAHLYRRSEGIDSTLLDEADEDEDEQSAKHPLGTPSKDVHSLQVKNSVRNLQRYFPKTQNQDNPLGDLTANLSRLDAPLPGERGVYQFYYFGKVTNRGPDFRGFHQWISFLVNNLYGRLTERIEDTMMLTTERQTVSTGIERLTFKGAAITFSFPEPLSNEVFNRFIELTFIRGAGPFRLWGNPLQRPGPRVHVYGLDLHLWQKVYLDMTPKRFLVILPQGTCGNTVHRLATNIQRYLEPQVRILLGATPYQSLIDDVWRQQLPDDPLMSSSGGVDAG